jgi:hypothetical protein
MAEEAILTIEFDRHGIPGRLGEFTANGDGRAFE